MVKIKLQLYKLQVKDKSSLNPKYEDESFLSGKQKFTSFKDAQTFKKKAQRMSSSLIYKIVKTK